MYFYLKRGKRCLDLRGDLILTHNDALVKARVKSAAPRFVFNGRRIERIAGSSIWRKLRASWAAIRFIWGENTALTKRQIDAEGL